MGDQAEDADVLAEFIVVLMLEQRKTRAEVASELAIVFADEAAPFVDWLEKCKAEIITKRPRPLPLAPPRLKVVGPVPTASRPPAEASGLRPSPFTPPDGSARHRADGYVVVTSKLVLQPAGVADGADFEEVAVQSKQSKAKNEAMDRKMELLSEMTKKLQEILGRLTDKSLDDETRERYQTMAQTLQGQLQSLADSRGSMGERLRKPAVVAETEY